MSNKIYTANLSAKKALNGIGVPVARRNKPRLTGSGFFIAQTLSIFGGLCGASQDAPDLARYANPHGLPPLIGVKGGRFSTYS